MIASIRIRNLGPHRDTPIQWATPAGRSVIWGPSRAGKSTIMDAVCFCLWGQYRHGRPFPLEAITDAAKEVSVELRLASGTTLRRTMQRAKRDPRREIIRPSGTTAYTTEKEWRAALGPLGRNVDALRVIMIPMAWRAMAGNPGKGRELRNLIASILPKDQKRTVIASIMGRAGHPLNPGDPLDEGPATALRARATKTAERMRGEADGLERLVAAVEGDVSDLSDLEEKAEAAHALLEEAREWEKYHAACDAHVETVEYRARQEEAAAAWDAEQFSLEEPPAVDRAVRKEAARKISKLEDQIERDRRLMASLTAVVDAGDVCPTCERGEWKKGAEKVRAAKKQLREKEARRKKATAALEEAQKAHVDLCAVNATRQEWERKRRDLGTRPWIPDIPDTPENPVGREPTEEWLEKATGAIRALDEAKGAQNQRKGDTTRTKDQLHDVRNALQMAEMEATRCEALVQAIRAAPSHTAKSGISALGSTEPVDLEFLDRGGVEVRIDGLPWWLASDGRLVHADARFRQGLRRAIGLSWLPIFVDRIQAISPREWPKVDGPLIVLETAAEPFHPGPDWQVIPLGL